tara:strand:+ start:3651 stop:4286 length:636 start_codon:yes stop_codon:yes gene_type:complete
MSLETDALDAVALATTNQTIAANALKNAIESLTIAYASTKNKVDTELNSVDNTSDADKIISNLMVTALNTKQATLVSGGNIATINGLSLLEHTALLIASSPTSLTSANYEERENLRLPSTPQPILGDALILEFLGLFQFYDTVEEPDDDETCFTVIHNSTGLPYGQWLLRVPSYEWTEAHEKIESRALEERRDDVDETVALLLANYNEHHP